MSDDSVQGPSTPRLDRSDPRVQAIVHRYWRTNVKIMAALLAVWAAVGLGCGVLFADALNNYSLGGFPLGFWFAQQGSIAVFVVLILIYALALNRLDRRVGRELRSLDPDPSASRP